MAENYDGNLGPGISNALFCSNRASALAEEHGIGLVTLKNTTHWMRGGTYAWKIAESGKIGICWIATESCMPMWGSDEPSVGNNPFCMAVPRENGEIVLDMAMSQYAYGKLGVYRLAGKCQIFIAIDPYLFGDKDEIQRKWDNRVERADKAHPIDSKKL